MDHSYPHGHVTVCVIADGLKNETTRQIESMGVDVINVSFQQSTKAKALNVALNSYRDRLFDAVIILDADNHMAPGFIEEVEHSLKSGFLAVQGRRMPKNENSGMAVLDGLSEEANNVIYGKGQFALGFSSRLAGSGMAFDFNLFKSVMPRIRAINGFDKELELLLVREGVRIAYNERAVILDEKVSDAGSFQRQRTRWLAAQYHFLQVHVREALRHGLGQRKADYLQKIVILAIPPRIVLPIILVLGACLGWIFLSKFTSLFFGLLFLLNVATYLFAVPVQYVDRKYMRQALLLPLAVGHTLLALIRIRSARDKFLHTAHGEHKSTVG
jgi:cellulose synthase/poly-beta-1,6-N-acetylglucosamine synthase-like glycosyltransferase